MTRRRKFEKLREEIEELEARRDNFPTDHDLELIGQARERQNKIAGGEEGRDRLLRIAVDEFDIDPENDDDTEKVHFAYTSAVSTYALNNDVRGGGESHETDMGELADEFRDELIDVLNGEHDEVLAVST